MLSDSWFQKIELNNNENDEKNKKKKKKFFLVEFLKLVEVDS